MEQIDYMYRYKDHDIETHGAMVGRIERAARDQGLKGFDLDIIKVWTRIYFSAPPHIAKKLSFEFMMRNSKHKVTELNRETYEAFLDEYYPDEKQKALGRLQNFKFGVYEKVEPIVKEEQYIVVAFDSTYVLSKPEWNLLYRQLKNDKKFVVIGKNYINKEYIVSVSKYEFDKSD